MSTKPNSNKLLSVNDLIEYFNISKATAYRLINSRKITFYKIGGCIRFDKQDILDYLEKNKINPIE